MHVVKVIGKLALKVQECRVQCVHVRWESSAMTRRKTSLAATSTTSSEDTTSVSEDWMPRLCREEFKGLVRFPTLQIRNRDTP